MLRPLALVAFALTAFLTGCGSTPDASGTTTGGDAAPPPFGVSVANPQLLALDGDGLVVTSLDSNRIGSLLRAPFAGGAVRTLAGGDAALDLNGTLAADAQRFYFYARTDANGGGGIFSIARGGGKVTKIADSIPAVGIAVDATRVYWIVSQIGQTIPNSPGAVLAAPLAGGAVTTLAANQFEPGGLVVDATSIYWTADPGALTGNNDPPQGVVVSMPLAGGAPVTLATGQQVPRQIVTDGTSLFWLDLGTPGIDCTPSDGAVMKLPIGGGAPVTLAANVGGVGSITLSGGDLYFSANGVSCNGEQSTHGTIFEVPAGATKAKVRIDDKLSLWAGSMLVDGATLYWTSDNVGGGSIKSAGL